jgi:hypothetical protein
MFSQVIELGTFFREDSRRRARSKREKSKAKRRIDFGE